MLVSPRLLSLGLITALSCILLPGVADAQSLGRLFTTPEERANLDEIRHDPDFGKIEQIEVVRVVDEPDGPVVPHVTINGVVFRSSGINASWINGLSVSSDTTREGIRIETRQLQGGGTVKLALPGGLETIQIKPGQKIDLLNGGVFEPYELQAEEDARLFEENEPSADTDSIGELLKSLTE